MTSEMPARRHTKYIRPKLEDVATVWSPHWKNHTGAGKGPEEYNTKKVPDLSGRRYEERRGALNLHSLEERRIRGGVITYRFLRGHDDVNIEQFIDIYI